MPDIALPASDPSVIRISSRRRSSRGTQMDFKTLSLMVEHERVTDLHKIRLLAGLDEPCVADIQRRCQFRAYPKGHTILHQDDATHDLMFVCHGVVRVVQYTLSGREIAHDEIPATGHFGEIAAIDGGGRSADVVAQQDSLLAVLPEKDFKEVLALYPAFALNVMRGLTQIIRGINSRVRDLSVLRAPERVVAELLRLAAVQGEATGDHMRIRKIPTTMQLAARCGTTRETVTRTLRDLTGRNLVARSGADLEILDHAGLKELMERATEL